MKTPFWTLCILLAFSGCDKIKSFMDPSGQAYGTTPAPGSPAAAAKPGAPPPPPAGSSAAAPSSPVGKMDVPIRLPAVGRNLSPGLVMSQISAIEFRDARGAWSFQNGIARHGGGLVSLVDSAGKPWALAIGDLDMDGSDDAVVVLRLDRAGEDTRWELAFLRNQGGRLFNTQTVALPGIGGFIDAAIEGNTVTLVPVDAGPNVFASYSGGEFSVSKP